MNEIRSDIVRDGHENPCWFRSGLLENVNEACLVRELSKRGRRIFPQAELPVIYEYVKLDVEYGIDILVDNTSIVEIKAVEEKHYEIKSDY